MSAEALTMQMQAPMTDAEHILAGQLSLDEMLAREQAIEAGNPSMFDRLKNSRIGHAVAKVAVFGALLGGGGEGVLAATAAAEPAAHEASGGWTHYGGDPLFPGGVHSRNQFVHDITSSRGQTAMSLMGLSKKEIKAIDLGARQGKETHKHFAFGTKFDKMSFGVNGVNVDTNVAFEDPSYPDGFDGYDLKVQIVTHKNVSERVHGKKVTKKETDTEQLEIVVPDKCANISLLDRKFSKHGFVPPEKKKPVPPAPVTPPATPPTPPAAPYCYGNTTNSGTNNGNGGQAQGGNCSTNINCSAIESPGAVVCSPETPGTPVSPPPTTEQLPPTITVQQKTPGFEGGDEQDQIVICAEASSNPASDGVTVTASDKYEGQLTIFQEDGEYCAEDTLPNFPETDDDVVFTATDNVNGKTATDDTGAFPVRQPQ
jgi:hypothetical protein